MRSSPASVMLAFVVTMVGCWGETRPETPILKDARAVLRICDGQGLDRSLGQVVAACGLDPAPYRQQLAEALYLSSSLEAIDLQRPTVIAWRDGHAPLVAIIPVIDRRAFMDDFGVLPFGQAPLVRIGDREGTIVYTQNLADRHDEYRLLISNNTAYLARTAAECLALAEHPLTLANEDYALGFSTWGPFAAPLASGLPVAIPSPGAAMPASLASLVSLVSGALPPLLSAQAVGWDWQLHLDSNHATFTGSCELDPQGSISQWLHGQPSQVLALNATVPDDCVLRLDCAPSWQGQCDAAGHALLESAKTAAGSRWSPTLAEAWTGLWATLDHGGALALGLQLHPAAAASWMVLLEHPQADVLGSQLTQVLALWNGEKAAGEITSGWSLAGSGGEVLLRSAGRTLVVCGATDHPQALAQSAMTRIDAAKTPGPSALAQVSVDLTRLVKALYGERIEPEAELPGVTVTGEVRAVHDALVVHASFPIADTISLLNKVNWK